MHKVLIAHGSEDVMSTLESIISCKYQTLTCADSSDAVTILQKEHPDAMILDLSLPGKGGLEVLREAAEYLPPVILATTWVTDQAVLKDAAALGVDYVSVLPGKLGILIYRLEDLLRQELTGTPVSLKAHLRALGIPNHLDGYRQLLALISMKAEDPTRALIKEIYSVIVEEMQLTDWRCVDRSIRAAIEKGWENGDRAVWQQYFPNAVSRPKVSTFIAELARQISDIN